MRRAASWAALFVALVALVALATSAEARRGTRRPSVQAWRLAAPAGAVGLTQAVAFAGGGPDHMMSTPAAGPAGGTAYTISVTFVADVHEARTFASQWSDAGQQSWVFGAAADPPYTGAEDGFRFWTDHAVFEYPVFTHANYSLTPGARYQIVARYAGADDAPRVRMWIAAQDAETFSELSTYTRGFFGNEVPHHTELRASTDTVNIGGDTYATSLSWDGLILDVATWHRALDVDTELPLLRAGVWPADPLPLEPVNWWRMGNGPGDSGVTIVDYGSEGAHGTLVTGTTPSTLPQIVSYP